MGSNRDERVDRPSLAPARHWPERPGVIAGKDCLAGGTWLGMNGQGVVAAIMNRYGTLGPSPDKHSRGELVLSALDHGSAQDAADALLGSPLSRYRAFNLVIADSRQAFWLRHGDDGQEAGLFALNPGISMFSAHDCNDLGSARIRHYLPRFQALAPFDPTQEPAWQPWQTLLASEEYEPGANPYEAMNIIDREGFATVSSSLIALPAAGSVGKPLWWFVQGAPVVGGYRSVSLAADV